MIEKKPLIFKPLLKSVIWGGDKICAYKGIEQTKERIGESWEISALPGYESVVDGGSYDGKTITELIDAFGAELLGDAVMKRYGGIFPLLIKFIDANDRLSVQVHPDNALAMKRHNSLGKAEMWYIIEAEKEACTFVGLNKKITPEEYMKYVAAGNFEDLLAVHSSKPGDVFFLPPGSVHAVGAGNLLAEIQVSSDITYRIYDYNRRDTEGHTRELHTELAKDAIDYTVSKEYKKAPVPADVANAEIVRCDSFITNRIFLDGEMPIPAAQGSFSILMCLRGKAEIVADGSSTELTAGHTVLLPAAMPQILLRGNATLLLTHA